MPALDPIDEDKQFLIRDYVSKTNTLKQGGVTNILEESLLDKSGEPTPLAEQHVTLFDSGLINEDGTLTDSGAIYNMTHRESVDAPRKVYLQREKLGLNEIDKANQESSGSIFSDLYNGAESLLKQTWTVSPARNLGEAYLKVVGKGLDAISSGVSSLLGEEEKDRKPIDIVPSFMEAPMTKEQVINAQISMVQGGADTLGMIGGAMKFLPMRAIEAIQGKEDEQIAIKQQQEKSKFEWAEIKGVEMFGAMFDTNALMENRDAVVKQIGEKATEKQEQSARTAGGFIYDPTNIATFGIGVASNAGLKTMLWAERTALTGKGLMLEAGDLAVNRAAMATQLEKAKSFVEAATTKADALRSVGKESQALRYEAYAAKASETAGELTSKIDDVAKKQAVIDADLVSIGNKAGIADKLISASEKLNAAKQLPFDAVAKVTGSIGQKLIKADSFVNDTMEAMGVSAVYDAFKSLPTKISSIASTAVIGPLGSVPAIATQILGAGPLMERISTFSKVLGNELIKERGSIGYWGRVANAGISKPQRMFAKFMDEATLGGSATNAVKIIAKGTAHGYPLNVAFEILQDPDLDLSNAAQMAIAPSLIFGGGGAGAGQIFKGSKGRLDDVNSANHINFIRSLTDSQKSSFYKMDGDAQKLTSSYSAAFPNLNWEFKESGSSSYDKSLNTVSVNINTNNPIKGLITHEVAHYLTIRNNLSPVIRQLLFGFKDEAGLLKSADGKLDPKFQKFKDEYDSRLETAGLDPVTAEYIGEEYFNEMVVEHMLDITESGKLSQYAGRTGSSRIINTAIRTMVEKRPVLRDFFFRTGGVMDSKGSIVQGNGLLSEGIMAHPETKKLIQQMMRESAGSTRVATGGVAKKFDKGKMEVNESSPIVDSFHAILEYDDKGNPIKDNGVHRVISRDVDEKRSRAGMILTEEQTRRVAGGYLPDVGELKRASDGTWQGQFIHRALLDELAVRSALNSKQISILRSISAATKDGSGARFIVVNHPATIKGRGGKVRYASLEATLRDVVPVGFSVTKQGNILVHMMSVDQLNANIEKRAASRSGDNLYGGNTELIKQDVSEMMDIHALKGKNTNPSTDAYYQTKYGAKWKQHKDFINTVFGLMTKDQKSYNPMFDADKVGDGGVYRTYRADRISKAIKDHSPPMPMSYEHIKVNMLPEGIPAKVEARNTEELRKNTLSNEIKTLQDQIDEMYSSGKTKGVEDLEAKLETLLEKSDTDLSAMEMESTQEFDSARLSPEEDLVDAWYRWTGQGEDNARNKDALQKEYKTFGQFYRQAIGEGDFFIDKNTTDAQIQKAAKDSAAAYEKRRSALKSTDKRYLPETDAENKQIKSLVNQGYDLMHSRGTQDIGKSKNVIQFADWPKQNQKNEHYGANKYVVKSSDLIPIPEWAIEWLSKKPEIILYAKEHGTSPLDEARRSMNPEDVVDSAGFWDDQQNVSDFYQENERVISDKGIVGFKTNDGGVIFDPYSANEKGIIRKIEKPSSNTRYLPEGKPKSKSDDNLKLLQTKKTLRNWAVTQESWKDWYSEHQETLDNFFGEYAGLFQEILAVTSQASSVKANVGLALKAFGQLMRNEEFDAKLRGLDKSGYLPAVIKNLNAVKNNTEVGGRKISNYKKANEGDSSRVVVDRHIARMLFGVDTPSAKQYAKAEQVLSDVAKQLGWEPAQVQAALWAQSIVMSGKDPVSYGAYLKDLESRKLTKKDLINGIKGNQLTKRIGEISGRSYGGDATSQERGRYSPAGETANEGTSGVGRDTRYLPEKDIKTINSNIPDKEGGNMRPSTWSSLSKVGYSPEASEKTQIATTAPTYESIVKANATKGMEVLDFSAGRGIGTKAMKAIGKKVGFNVEGYEPFSNAKTRVITPEYEGEKSIDNIPNNSKDIIVNNAVLNVVPEDTGRQIVQQIYSKLKPEGSAFINVMGWNNIKNRLDNPKTQLVGPREVVTQRGTFQKGYTAQSLRSLIEQELPDAKIIRTSHGDIGFKVTKPASRDTRYMPEGSKSHMALNSVTPNGEKFIKGETADVKNGSVIGTIRFLPEAENKRLLTNFPLSEEAKNKMAGKTGFAFTSDWSDSNRPYITQNGREIDVLLGGVGYTYHPKIIGKGGWAGSFSPLTDRVLKKINNTDGIGLVVAGGRDSTSSSRSFSLALMEELKDSINTNVVTKPAIDNIIKMNAQRIIGRTDINSLNDYLKLLQLKNTEGGLTFEQRENMVQSIGSHDNKKKFGILSWKDVLKKYEMQNGTFETGQIMSVVQFKKNAPLVRASEIKAKDHKSYEAVIQGSPIGVLTKKVMIADFFKDFLISEGTMPKSYTRKVQTKMPEFKYGTGSAVF